MSTHQHKHEKNALSLSTGDEADYVTSREWKHSSLSLTEEDDMTSPTGCGCSSMNATMSGAFMPRPADRCNHGCFHAPSNKENYRDDDKTSVESASDVEMATDDETSQTEAPLS